MSSPFIAISWIILQGGIQSRSREQSNFVAGVGLGKETLVLCHASNLMATMCVPTCWFEGEGDGLLLVVGSAGVLFFLDLDCCRRRWWLRWVAGSVEDGAVGFRIGDAATTRMGRKKHCRSDVDAVGDASAARDGDDVTRRWVGFSLPLLMGKTLTRWVAVETDSI
ncbi:hypothetical protein ACLOJK_022364, partial [Asimina triloba]